VGAVSVALLYRLWSPRSTEELLTAERDEGVPESTRIPHEPQVKQG